MIAFKGGRQNASGKRTGMIPRFDAAVHYLHHGSYLVPKAFHPDTAKPDRVAWVSLRNLRAEDSWEAVTLMEATAAQNGRVERPGYHIGASLPPGESLDREQWEEVADAILEGLGLEEHQAIIALHEDRGHQHVHLIVNRVHVRGHVWKPSFDDTKLMRVMRTMERRFDLRRVPPRERPMAASEEAPEAPPPRAWDEKLAAARMRRVLLEQLRRAESWDELDAVLAGYGIRLAPARRGGGAMAIEGKHRIRMSEIDRALSGVQLARRFGEPLRAYLARAGDRRPPLAAATVRIEIEDARAEATRIIEDLGARHATWTERDVRIEGAHRPDLERVLALVLHDERVQRIALDSNGDVRFTTRDYLADETLLFEAAKRLAGRHHLAIGPAAVERVLGAIPQLTPAQKDAVMEASSRHDLALVSGTAQSGKTAVGAVVARAYREAGHTVIGVAPSARSAHLLGARGGMDARALDAWRYAWRNPKIALRPGTVVIVDDAGQLETRRLAELLARIEKAGGKAVLLGDPEGLQPMGPGAPLRGLLDHYPTAELPAARLDLAEWEKEAHERAIAGGIAEVVAAFDARGQLHWAPDREAAIDEAARQVVERMKAHPGETVLAITSTRDEAASINAAVRDLSRAHGELDATVKVRAIDLGVGDRVRFLRSDRGGEHVKANGPGHEPAVIAGELGTVRAIRGERLEIERDRGASVTVDPQRYDHLEHAYAINVHQATARKVDHAIVLATRHADRHQISVALSRHRKAARIVTDRQTFRSDLDLLRLLSRDRGKDTIGDYGRLALGDTDPEKALDLVRRLEAHEATWSRQDFLGLAGKARHLADHLDELPEVVPLPGGLHTTRRYLEAEVGMRQGAERLAASPAAEVTASSVERLAQAHALSAEQQRAFTHLASRRLGLVTGRAGAGKTRLTRALVEHAAEQGLEVRGAALAGKAADVLAHEAGIEAQTLAAWTSQWGRAEGHLSARDVLVVDEASMVDVRTMATVFAEVERAGARLVLLGDPAQLEPIGAGHAFRALLDRIEPVALDEIRRQRHGWQVEASRHAAAGRFGAAISAYADRGAVHVADDPRAARGALVDRYLAQGQGDSASAVVLSHRRADVRALNHAIHEARHERGEIRGGIRFRGREFSAGDRVILGANDPDQRRVRVIEGEGHEASAGVRNGALGTIEAIDGREIRLRLDDGRLVAFDPGRYPRFDHGYATTIHKAQGITVDRAYLLASPSLDRAAAYVALTRHRDSLEVFASRGEFESREALVEAMSRLRHKSLALDTVGEDEARHLLSDHRGGRKADVTIEREPSVLDPRLRGQVLEAALGRLREHDDLERGEQEMRGRVRSIRDAAHARAYDEPIAGVVAKLGEIYRQPDAARREIEQVIERHGLVPTLRALAQRPESFGRLRLGITRSPRRYAEKLASWAIDQHKRRAADPEVSREIAAAEHRVAQVQAQREGLSPRQDIRFEIGLLAASMSRQEIDALPKRDRALITELQEEHSKLQGRVKTALKALTRLEGRPTQRDRTAVERALAPVMHAATRQALFRLSPPAVRSLMRASRLTRNPAALLIHLAPPQLRPLLYLVSIARSVVRSISRGR